METGVGLVAVGSAGECGCIHPDLYRVRIFSAPFLDYRLQ